MNTPDPAFIQALKQLILEAADKTEPAGGLSPLTRVRTESWSNPFACLS